MWTIPRRKSYIATRTITYMCICRSLLPDSIFTCGPAWVPAIEDLRRNGEYFRAMFLPLPTCLVGISWESRISGRQAHGQSCRRFSSCHFKLVAPLFLLWCNSCRRTRTRHSVLLIGLFSLSQCPRDSRVCHNFPRRVDSQADALAAHQILSCIDRRFQLRNWDGVDLQ
jgi:hypothetical protein